jgi:hypothetical protein
MLSAEEQRELKSLLKEHREWGLVGHRKSRLAMLQSKQGSAAQNMKQGKTKFLATADIDRQMGGVLLSALKPENVDITHVNSDRGTTGMWSTSYDASQAARVSVSKKARWEDLQVASRRSKNAPVLPVIELLLPSQMVDVWIGLESAHSAYKQAKWTHNDKIVDEQKRWLQRTNQGSLQNLVQRSALGIPVTDAMQTMYKASDIQWLVDHSLELQDAVKAAEDMEALVEVAMWVGEELGLIQDQQQDEPIDGCGPRTPTDRNTDKDSDNKSGENTNDSKEADDSKDTDGSKKDKPDNTKDIDGKADRKADGKADGKDSNKTEQDKTKSLKDKVKEAVTDAMEQQDNAPVQQDALFDLVPTEQEEVTVIEPDAVPKRLIALHPAAKPAQAEFELLDDEQDDYFGDPQGDILHDIRLGILDVFEQETASDPQLIIAVDNSISMRCNCGLPRRNSRSDTEDAGYLAWQVAGILGKQFPDSKIFGWTTSRRGRFSRDSIVFDMPEGYRPACTVHEKIHDYSGNTPEAEALLYAQSQLESNENSVIVVITDGEPNDKSRSYGITHAMYKAGTKFAVVTVGNYQPALADLHYPPATVLSIKSPVELSKVSRIFDLIRK